MTTKFERAVVFSILDIMDYGGVTVADLAARTNLDIERSIDAFAGTQCFTLIEFETVCNALNVDVAEQMGMIS